MLRRLLLPLLVVAATAGPVGAQSVDPEPIAWADRHTIRSRVLDEERDVLVALPRAYGTSGQRYPVLYVLDGEWHFETAVAAVRFLSETSYLGTPQIPEMIVVGVVNVDRNRDYTPTHRATDGRLEFPTSGEAERFLAFLQREVAPYIDARFRTQPYRAVTGWSFGGLFAIHTMLTTPGAFDAYLAISPSLWWDDRLLVRMADSLFAAGAAVEGSLVVTLGGETGSIRPAVLAFVEALERAAPPRLRWSFDSLPGLAHNFVTPPALYEGLRELYAGWLLPAEALARGLPAVEAFYDSLSAATGYEVIVPEAAFIRLARRSWSDDRFDDALTACERHVSLYPASPEALYFRGAARENLGDRDGAARDYQAAYDLEAARASPSRADLDRYRTAIDRVTGSPGG